VVPKIDASGRILSWMRDGREGDFEELAVEMFVRQYRENRAYRNFCEWQGVVAGRVDGWWEIPAVPTDAFKVPAHPLRCFEAGEVRRRFLTSGTTLEVRGCHEFAEMAWYEASILGAWRELGLPDFGNPWFIAQSPQDAPQSSLSHMFGTLLRASGAEGRRWLMDGGGEVDPGALRRETKPVALFSTALALLRCGERGGGVELPEGSWIFETGGYKGMEVALDPAEFRTRVGRFFGVPESAIFNEYSMTELSSQFYRIPGARDHEGPPWVRVRVVDPETGGWADEGGVGYLEVVDLANVGSVMAVRTQDLAIRRGDSTFTLLGRDPGAVVRGCSRGADAAMQLQTP
jgi:hypothetical protein